MTLTFRPVTRADLLLALDDGTPVGLVQRSRLADLAGYRDEFAALTGRAGRAAAAVVRAHP